MLFILNFMYKKYSLLRNIFFKLFRNVIEFININLLMRDIQLLL